MRCPMKTVKAIIADDEAPLRQFLRARLSEAWPELVICGEAKNGPEALALIERDRPHIAFLDIKMPGLSGMEVTGKITRACRVVFVTAYARHAVEAFEKEAVDYLLKPVSPERLLQTVSRLKKEMAAGPETGAVPGVSGELLDRIIAGFSKRETVQHLQYVRVQLGDGIRLIPVDEVIFFRAGDKYTAVITRQGESLIRKPIRELAEALDPAQFYQIHRSVIVNVRFISRVSRSLTGRGVVRLKDHPESLTVSKRYLHRFKQM